MYVGKKSEKKKKKKITIIHYNGGSIPIVLKVHKNPYLWDTNKTVVATIMVHSYTNSINSNT
jgi:hypothetical protein